MNILGTIGELIRKDEISEYLTVSASDGKDVLFFEEELAIGSLLRFNALSGASDQTQIALNTVCNEKYPAGTIMQIIQFGSPNLEQTVHQYTKLRDIAEQQPNTDSDNSRDFCIDSTRSRAQAFLDFTRDRVVPSSDVRLTETNSYWTLKIPLTIKEFLGTQKKLDQIQREIEDFKIMRARLMSQLQTAGIQSYPVETAEYLAIMRRYFDVYGDWDWRWDPQAQLLRPDHAAWLPHQVDRQDQPLPASERLRRQREAPAALVRHAGDRLLPQVGVSDRDVQGDRLSGTGPQIGVALRTVHDGPLPGRDDQGTEDPQGPGDHGSAGLRPDAAMEREAYGTSTKASPSWADPLRMATRPLKSTPR